MPCCQTCSCSPARRTRSTSIIRMSSVTAPKAARLMSASGWWIGDHRREVRFGDELAVDARAAGELAHRGALLDELDIQPEQDPGLDRRAKFRAFDGHEINELARAGEAQRFDREHAR